MMNKIFTLLALTTLLMSFGSAAELFYEGTLEKNPNFDDEVRRAAQGGDVDADEAELAQEEGVETAGDNCERNVDVDRDVRGNSVSVSSSVTTVCSS